MIIDFKKLDLHERPLLILRNLDCKAFGVLGKAFNVKIELKYNEVSKLTFDYPAVDNGEDAPFYDEIKAMNIVDLKDCGQFILKSVDDGSDGIRTVKTCTAYSLEYELTYKQFFAAKGTYNLWNPVSPAGTIIGMVLETMPYWSIGNIDVSLIGKYRTFEANGTNVYDFIKNTAQNTYGCVFTFDTYTRKINVSDATAKIVTSPLFISLDNIVKNLEINMDTENIYTCFEPFGADDLNIRSVNPLGNNKIYAMDYFMNTTNLSESIIYKWNTWKKLFESKQLPYYNLMVEESVKSAQLLTEQTALTDIKGELKGLEAEQSVCVQYLSEHGHDAAQQKKLDAVNVKIANKRAEIKTQETLLVSIKAEITAIGVQKKTINDELSFKNTFTPEEVMSFSKYIKESTIQDSTFVVSTVKSYNTADISSKHNSAAFAITGAAVTRIAMVNSTELYSVTGGSLTCPCGDKQLTADIVRGTLERKSDGSFVMSAYLNKGENGAAVFPSGNISVTGKCGAIKTDVVPDPKVPDAFSTGINLSFTSVTAKVYFTQNATEYEARSVQFDLYEYAKKCLEKASVPAYSFSLDAINFLALDEFLAFKDALTLGGRVYLDTEKYGVLQPVVVGVNVDFEDITNFSMVFCDKFSAKDTGGEIVDILRQSISMGSKYNSDQYSSTVYTDSGAADSINNYINNAFDVAKQEILATVGQAISWDENGMHLRKWNADRSGYEPQQIWMNNNNINFSDDNWGHVKTALGKVQIGNQNLYGLVAEVILGNAILGNNFTISSEKEHGGIQEFRVDGAGVRLYNGSFYVAQDGGGQIVINAKDGIMLGTTGLFVFDKNGVVTVDKAKANMWLGLDGYIHTKGDIYAKNLYFLDGTDVKTLLSEKTKKIDSTLLDLGGIQLDGVTGDITLIGNINLSNGNINWGKNIPNKQRYAASTAGPWHDSMQSGDIYCCDWNYTTNVWGAPYKKVGTDGEPGHNGSDANVTYPNVKNALNRANKAAMTIIDGASVDTVDIHANNIYGGHICAGDGTGSYAMVDGDSFELYTDNVAKPKASMWSVNNGQIIGITLGAGSGENRDILTMKKAAGIGTVGYMTPSATFAGFNFYADRTIEVVGDLKANYVLA